MQQAHNVLDELIKYKNLRTDTTGREICSDSKISVDEAWCVDMTGAVRKPCPLFNKNMLPLPTFPLLQFAQGHP